MGRQRGDSGGIGGGTSMGAPSSSSSAGEGGSKLASSAANRADKIQQLRLQHQHQHRARQGLYPHEPSDELYEQHLQDDERRSNMSADVLLPHDSQNPRTAATHDLRSVTHSLHHLHHQVEIHHDPRTSEPLPDPRVIEPHHYTNTRVVEDEYAQPHSMRNQRQQPLRPARNDVLHNPQAGLLSHRSEHYSPGDGTLHSHRADIHHAPPRLMEMHPSDLRQDLHHPDVHRVDIHRADLHRSDQYRSDAHRQNLRVDVSSELRGRDLALHSPRTQLVEVHQDPRGREMDPRSRDLDSRGRDLDSRGRDMDPRGLPRSHHSEPQSREMSVPHHHQSHLGVYDDTPSYGNDYNSRPVSRQSEAFRNSPYPIGGIGSQSAPLSHPISHSYPSSHSSHTLQGYDPHLLYHHHHHHHLLPNSHHYDSQYEQYDGQYDLQYDLQYDPHYSAHDDNRAGSREIKKRDSFVERQRQYFDEMNRGIQEPPRHVAYAGTQRPVSRFGDPGSAKV